MATFNQTHESPEYMNRGGHRREGESCSVPSDSVGGSIITSEDSFRKQGILSRADRKTSQFLKSQEQRQVKDNPKDESSKDGERRRVTVAGRWVQMALKCMGIRTH